MILSVLKKKDFIDILKFSWTRFTFSHSSKKQLDFQQQHVYKVYDRIAEHFSETRYKPWPKVANFLQHLKKGSIVADVGCGNGRNMDVNPSIEVIGIDRCIPLLNIAQQRRKQQNFMAGDILKLPVRSESFDALICIALLHHLSSEQMRIKSLQQLGRILKKGSQGLIYVRSMEVMNNKNQLRKVLEKQDFFVPWHLQKKYEKDMEKAVSEGARYIAEKHSIIYERYYHAFQEGQLESLLIKSGVLKIRNCFYDKSNWACIVQKG